MKNSVRYACAVAVAVIIGPLAHGGTISTSSTDMSAFSAGATFRMSVNSGGNIAANTGFTTPTTATSAQSFLLTISPGQEPGPGATLTSATLDLSRLASPTDGTLTTVMSGTGGTVHPVNVIAPRINDLPEHQQQRYLDVTDVTREYAACRCLSGPYAVILANRRAELWRWHFLPSAFLYEISALTQTDVLTAEPSNIRARRRHRGATLGRSSA